MAQSWNTLPHILRGESKVTRLDILRMGLWTGAQAMFQKHQETVNKTKTPTRPATSKPTHKSRFRFFKRR